jgi:uncharacterized protein involved in outer membrane biogenesis
MKKLLLKIAIGVIVCLALLVVGSILFLGSILKRGVETVGPQLTKTDVKLDGASLSILSGSGSIKGLVVGNPEGYKTPSAIKVGSVNLGVRPGSVFSDKIHVTLVNVQAPEITFEGNLKGNNLDKILENVQAASGTSGTEKSQPAPKDGATKKLQVDELVISGGKVNVSLTLMNGRSATVPLPDIHFKNLGQGPEGITAAELTEKILREITAATLKAVEPVLADLGKAATDALKDAGKNATQSLDRATKSLGDLFKKK